MTLVDEAKVIGRGFATQDIVTEELLAAAESSAPAFSERGY